MTALIHENHQQTTTQLLSHSEDVPDSKRVLTIGMVAPPWVPVPPPAYGGIELAIDVLARGLAARGQRVRLFTVGSSTCPVRREWVLPEPPDRIGDDLDGLTHALAAYEALADCDVIHDHTLAGPALAAAGWDGPPVVTTNHGPFDNRLSALYRRTAPRVPLIAISADQAAAAPDGVPVAVVIPHGVDLDAYPARLTRRGAGGYLLCLGRMSPTKGIDLAIHAARAAGRRLVIAAKCREPDEVAYYHQVIEPLLDDRITYVGEVDHTRKVDLLRGADALLNPIAWPEPFGLVMVEALACGTPVIATPNGAAKEIVDHGRCGWLAANLDDLTTAIEAAYNGAIDRRQCRHHAVTHYSMQAMAREHEHFYRNVLTHRAALRYTSQP
jgi:glycosyltransferase involved in cell wall biosynthesis